jgi:hypothetical protein
VDKCESGRALLGGLLDGARKGRNGTLVVRDEAGIGKPALLEHAGDVASAMDDQQQSDRSGSAAAPLLRSRTSRLSVRETSPRTGYGVYSSAVATGSLEHCLGVQFASLAPPTLRTCPVGSNATAEPPWRG